MSKVEYGTQSKLTPIPGPWCQQLSILPSIGIKIEVRKLPSWKAKECACSKAFGDNMLSMAWCKARSWLFPWRHRALVNAYQKLQRRAQAELLNAVMESGRETLDEQ